MKIIISIIFCATICFSQDSESVVDTLHNMGAAMVFNSAGNINAKYTTDAITKRVLTNAGTASYVNAKGDSALFGCTTDKYYDSAISGVKYDAYHNTWIVWCKITTWVGYGGIFNFRGADTEGIVLGGSTGYIYGAGTEPNCGITVGNWQMITVTHDCKLQTTYNYGRIYRNNVLKYAAVGNLNFVMWPSRVTMGTETYSSSGRSFKGEIGLGVIFPRVLSHTEVDAIYNLTRGAYQ